MYVSLLAMPFFTMKKRISSNFVNSNQKVDHCGNEKVDHPKVVKSGCFLHFLSQFIVTFPETVRFPLKNQNVGMMGQPIQKSRRQGGISKDLRPTGNSRLEVISRLPRSYRSEQN